MTMTTLDDVVRLAAPEHFLAVISTVRADSTVQASLVNAGIMDHPFNGRRVVAFVTYGRAKLGNLRVRPQISVTYRASWAWATVEGQAELIGPGDPHDAVDAERLRLLLREIFVAAGGTHDDWEGYDATMLAQGRSAVFVDPSRIYSN